MNGTSSVLAQILAIVLSLNFGLTVTLGIGGLCFAVALVGSGLAGEGSAAGDRATAAPA